MATKNKEKNMSKVTNLEEKREEKESQNYNLIPYQIDDSNFVNVKQAEDTIWLSQNQIAKLFQTDKTVISKHLQNIFNEGELDKNSTVAFFATVENEGGRTVSRNITYYNLNAIISVGYRVSSKKATMFRQWATKILTEHLTKPYEEKIAAYENREVKKLGTKKISKNESERLAIKYLLKSRGITIIQIANDLNRSYDHVQKVPSGNRHSNFILNSIKEILGINQKPAAEADTEESILGINANENDKLVKKAAILIKDSLYGDLNAYKKIKIFTDYIGNSLRDVLNKSLNN